MMAVLQIIIANNHLLSPLSPSETLFRFNNIFYSRKKLFQLILTDVLKIMKNCLKKRNSRKCRKIEFALRNLSNTAQNNVRVWGKSKNDYITICLHDSKTKTTRNMLFLDLLSQQKLDKIAFFRLLKLETKKIIFFTDLNIKIEPQKTNH
jgi:hypothetical protein